MNSSLFSNLTLGEIPNITNITGAAIPSSYSYLSWDLLFRLVVLGIGIFTNIINISVFLNHRLKDTSYKYMLVNSITNFLYLTITFAGVFAYNCTYCPSSQSYPSVIYSIALIFYVSSCLAIFRILVEIAISVRTYLILINKSFNRLSYKQILFILFLIAFVYYFQQTFIYDIVRLNGTEYQTIFASRTNWLGNSPFFKNLVLVQFSIRIFLAVIVLSTVNFLNVIAFGRKLASRRNMTKAQKLNSIMQTTTSKIECDQSLSVSQSGGASNIRQQSVITTNALVGVRRKKPRTSKNLTRMVIWSSFLSALGTTPYALIYILNRTAYVSAPLVIHNSMSLVLLITPPTFEILVYYTFNRHYRTVLKSYLIKMKFIAS